MASDPSSDESNGSQPDDTSLDRRRSLSPEIGHSGTAQMLPHDGDRTKYLHYTHSKRKKKAEKEVYIRNLRCSIARSSRSP